MLNTSSTYGAWKYPTQITPQVAGFHAPHRGWFWAPPDSRGLYLYRSVANVRSANYWQDPPAQQSMELNYEMARQGLRIERIAIIADDLWPANNGLPIEPLRSWLVNQQRSGIDIQLVRHSTLESEPDLVGDFGIYGNRALGTQQLNDHGRTIKFTLSFDFADVLEAEKRWERLSVYAQPLECVDI